MNLDVSTNSCDCVVYFQYEDGDCDCKRILSSCEESDYLIKSHFEKFFIPNLEKKAFYLGHEKYCIKRFSLKCLPAYDSIYELITSEIDTDKDVNPVFMFLYETEPTQSYKKYDSFRSDFVDAINSNMTKEEFFRKHEDYFNNLFDSKYEFLNKLFDNAYSYIEKLLK